MTDDDDYAILDTYDLIQTARGLDPARAERQREWLDLVRGLPALELLEDARFLLKLASMRQQDEAATAAAEIAHFQGRVQRALPATRRRRGRPRKQDRPAPTVLPEIAALNTLRLQRNLSYRALAEAVQKTGGWVNMDTLRTLLKGQRRPHARTLKLIQKFLRAQAKEHPPHPDAPVEAPPADPDPAPPVESTH